MYIYIYIYVCMYVYVHVMYSMYIHIYTYIQSRVLAGLKNMTGALAFGQPASCLVGNARRYQRPGCGLLRRALV